jgi:hypothetical protein
VEEAAEDLLVWTMGVPSWWRPLASPTSSIFERSHELAGANLFSLQLFVEEKGNAERENKQK